jgi:hypothetical protein
MMDKQATVARWQKRKRTLRIIFAIIALLTGIGCIMVGGLDSVAFLNGGTSGIYWLMIEKSLAQIVSGTISLIASWLVIALWYPAWPERILSAVIWLILGCGILTFLGPPIGEPYTHVDSITTRDGVYHTGRIAMWQGSCPGLRGDCTDAYLYTSIVFRCDPLGLLCRAVYHSDEQLIHARIDNLPAGTFTRDGSTIRLVIDGQAVWEISNQ